MKIFDYLKIYAQIMRLDKPVGIWLLLFPTITALYIANIEHNSKLSMVTLIIFVIGSIFMRSAGCVINDYFDKDFDGKVERTKNRPLVKYIKYPQLAKHALFLALFLAICSGFLVILFCNLKTILFALVALVIAVTYPLFKRFFSLPQAYLGLAFSMGIPMAYTAQNIPLLWITAALLAANIFLVFAYDTAYAMVDKIYDVEIGIKTSAIFLGTYAQISILICTILYWLIHAFIMLYYQYAISACILLAFGLLKISFYDYKKLYSSDAKQYFQMFISNQYVVIFTFVVWYISSYT